MGYQTIDWVRNQSGFGQSSVKAGFVPQGASRYSQLSPSSKVSLSTAGFLKPIWYDSLLSTQERADRFNRARGTQYGDLSRSV